MDNLSIIEQCKQIMTDKNILNHNDLNVKWDNFKTKYPHLYDMLIMNETVDFNMLEYMCNLADKQNKVSIEEQLEYDFEVGDTLAKKYLYDKYPEPNSTQKEFIKESLRKKLKKN